MAKNIKFTVTIEETVSQSFEVYAEDLNTAMKTAAQKYRNGEFVLEPGEILGKQMSVYDSRDGSYTEWVEF